MSSAAGGRFGFAGAAFRQEHAHGGERPIASARVIERKEQPLHFIDLTVVPPGADIGRHTHACDNEELYVIVSGRGRMRLDDRELDVGPGDVVVNRPGGTHALRNTSDEEMRIVVVEVSAPAGDRE